MRVPYFATFVVALGCVAHLAAAPAPLVVSVAASLGEVMSELARRHEAATGQPVRLNVAGSNVLARQIIAGAPADLIVTADQAQMDAIERAGRLVTASRVDLLTNQLVVVGRPGGPLLVGDPAALASANVRRVAMGNPESVPAGIYARQWLERRSAWVAIRPKVVPTLSVRAALAAAKAGRVDAAVVYATDAQSEPGVPVVFRVPVADAPAIVYPTAVVAGPRREAAARLLTYLRSRDARAVFEAAGFGVVPSP